MTRKEEISDARNYYGVNVRKGYPRIMDETDKYISNAFEAGAKWADEHPSQELKQKFIDKAVRWLKDNALHYCYKSAFTGDAMIDINRLAERFEIAMQEE